MKVAVIGMGAIGLAAALASVSAHAVDIEVALPDVQEDIVTLRANDIQVADSIFVDAGFTQGDVDGINLALHHQVPHLQDDGSIVTPKARAEVFLNDQDDEPMEFSFGVEIDRENYVNELQMLYHVGDVYDDKFVLGFEHGIKADRLLFSIDLDYDVQNSNLEEGAAVFNYDLDGVYVEGRYDFADDNFGALVGWKF